MHIFIAEDDLINQEYIGRLLRKLGCHVTIASNGREAVDFSAVWDFDIAFMDIQMPEIDGFEATRLIRERERRTGKRVPIVACTAHALSGYEELCLRSGMDGYVTKPLSREKLIQTVESFTSIERDCWNTGSAPAPPVLAAWRLNQAHCL